MTKEHSAKFDGLVSRIRQTLSRRRNITEKRMFGGMCFFVNGNMIAGVSGPGELMVRVGPEKYEEALTLPFASEMDFTGRPMRGFVSVDDEGIENDDDLKSWIGLGLKYARSLPVKEKN